MQKWWSEINFLPFRHFYIWHQQYVVACEKRLCCRFSLTKFFRPYGCSSDWYNMVHLTLLYRFICPDSAIGAYAVVLWLSFSFHVRWKNIFLTLNSVSYLSFTLKDYVLDVSIVINCALNLAHHAKVILILWHSGNECLAAHTSVWFN